MEESLHQSAPTSEAYKDNSTLELRLDRFYSVDCTLESSDPPTASTWVRKSMVGKPVNMVLLPDFTSG